MRLIGIGALIGVGLLGVFLLAPALGAVALVTAAFLWEHGAVYVVFFVGCLVFAIWKGMTDKPKEPTIVRRRIGR
jgi:uncharacterized membrane protein